MRKNFSSTPNRDLVQILIWRQNESRTIPTIPQLPHPPQVDPRLYIAIGSFSMCGGGGTALSSSIW